MGFFSGTLEKVKTSLRQRCAYKHQVPEKPRVFLGFQTVPKGIRKQASGME
jgi:hypothetical protein